MQASITCFGPAGDSFDWKPVWSRLPEFLKAYPPQDGWRVEIRHGHLLDTSPALLELAKVTLNAGKDLQTIGLTTADMSAYVYTAHLIDADNKIVRTASARSVAPAAAGKTWEAGETAALNRLMAMLGFGGHLLDADEAKDREIQGITVTIGAGVQPSAPTPSKAPQAPQTAKASSNGAARTRPPKAVTSKQLEDKGVSKQVQRYLLKVVGELAFMGQTVELPELTSDAQARDYLKELEARREGLKKPEAQSEEIPS